MSNYRITTIDPDYFSETNTVNSTSAQSSAVTTGSGIIRISVSTRTSVVFGSNPTASVEDCMIPENSVEFFNFKSGDKVAFIHHGGGSGIINITSVD